jgi:hypothetical protein
MKTPNQKRKKWKKAAENRQGVCGMTYSLVSRRVVELQKIAIILAERIINGQIFVFVLPTSH